MPSNDAIIQQIQFLKGIEDVIPTTSSLASELCDLLEISPDSAYRRMRGETLLTISEIVTLCKHFSISFDAFSKVVSGIVSFTYEPVENTAESFAQFLDETSRKIEHIANARESKVIFACQDIPMFFHFNYPELANFMIFYWMRTIMNLPDLSKVKYDADFQIPELLEKGKSIFNAYINIPSTEVWTEATIQNTLRQISFYWESGIFDTKEDALRVCAALSKEVEDIEQMAELGTKKLNDTSSPITTDEADQVSINYKLYVSDIEVNNNTLMAYIGESQTVSLGHFSFNIMTTSNEIYCKKTEQWINNIIKKSTLVSGASEKQRFQFFQRVNKMIDDLMKRIAEG